MVSGLVGVGFQCSLVIVPVLGVHAPIPLDRLAQTIVKGDVRGPPELLKRVFGKGVCTDPNKID